MNHYTYIITNIITETQNIFKLNTLKSYVDNGNKSDFSSNLEPGAGAGLNNMSAFEYMHNNKSSKSVFLSGLCTGNDEYRKNISDSRNTYLVKNDEYYNMIMKCYYEYISDINNNELFDKTLNPNHIVLFDLVKNLNEMKKNLEFVNERNLVDEILNVFKLPTINCVKSIHYLVVCKNPLPIDFMRKNNLINENNILTLKKRNESTFSILHKINETITENDITHNVPFTNAFIQPITDIEPDNKYQDIFLKNLKETMKHTIKEQYLKNPDINDMSNFISVQEQQFNIFKNQLLQQKQVGNVPDIEEEDITDTESEDEEEEEDAKEDELKTVPETVSNTVPETVPETVLDTNKILNNRYFKGRKEVTKEVFDETNKNMYVKCGSSLDKQLKNVVLAPIHKEKVETPKAQGTNVDIYFVLDTLYNINNLVNLIDFNSEKDYEYYKKESSICFKEINSINSPKNTYLTGFEYIDDSFLKSNNSILNLTGSMDIFGDSTLQYSYLKEPQTPQDEYIYRNSDSVLYVCYNGILKTAKLISGIEANNIYKNPMYKHLYSLYVNKIDNLKEGKKTRNIVEMYFKNKRFSNHEKFSKLFEDFRSVFYTSKEFISEFIKENYILTESKKDSIRFTNFLNMLTEAIDKKYINNICIEDYSKKLPYTTEELIIIKNNLPKILKFLNLKKVRSSEGIKWYGIKCSSS